MYAVIDATIFFPTAGESETTRCCWKWQGKHAEVKNEWKVKTYHIVFFFVATVHHKDKLRWFPKKWKRKENIAPCRVHARVVLWVDGCFIISIFRCVGCIVIHFFSPLYASVIYYCIKLWKGFTTQWKEEKL